MNADTLTAPQPYTFWLCDCSYGWPRHRVSELKGTISAQGITIHGSAGFTLPWVQVLDCKLATAGAYIHYTRYAKLSVVGQREPLCLTPIDVLRPRTPSDNVGEAIDLTEVINALRTGTPIAIDTNPYVRAFKRYDRPAPAEIPGAEVDPWVHPVPEPAVSAATRKFRQAMLLVMVLILIGFLVALSFNNVGLALAFVFVMIAAVIWAPAYFNRPGL